jgi:hypothetical protein
MSWKPNETDIVDYLYGELTPDLQKKFTDYMQANDDFVREVKNLQQVQGVLPSLPDEEVILPLQFSTVTSAEKGSKGSIKWLYPVSIAASIAAILVVGYFTRFSISYGEKGFRMAFSEATPAQDVSLSEEEIKTLIDTRVNLVANQWQDQVAEIRTSFTAQLDQNKRLTEKEIKRVANSKKKASIDDEQILAFITQLKDENRQMMQTFYQASADEQQKYMRNILLDFQDYLDARRQEDMQVIQANLLEIQSTSELKQEETDKILASIITTVNNQNSSGQ